MSPPSPRSVASGVRGSVRRLGVARSSRLWTFSLLWALLKEGYGTWTRSLLRLSSGTVSSMGGGGGGDGGRSSLVRCRRCDVEFTSLSVGRDLDDRDDRCRWRCSRSFSPSALRSRRLPRR